MKSKTLIYFCKHPEPGFVKSRLSKDVGNLLTSKIYQIILEHTLQCLYGKEFEIKLFCHPNTDHPFFTYLNNKYKVSLHCQTGHDIGERMYNAFKECVQNNLNAVLIGSDCMELDSAYVKNAFQELERGKDVVLGPTLDGGYALIGLRQVSLLLFNDIAWGTDKVLQQTKDRIVNNDWTYSCLSEIRDIDTQADYLYFSNHKRYKHLFSNLNNEINLTS